MTTAQIEGNEEPGRDRDDAIPGSHGLLKELLQEMFGMTPEQSEKALGDLDGCRRN